MHDPKTYVVLGVCAIVLGGLAVIGLAILLGLALERWVVRPITRRWALR